jgi:hypothetical protein
MVLSPSQALRSQGVWNLNNPRQMEIARMISLKTSTQQGLKGLMGYFRRVVVNKTLSVQEESLVNIKKALEIRE